MRQRAAAPALFDSRQRACGAHRSDAPNRKCSP